MSPRARRGPRVESSRMSTADNSALIASGALDMGQIAAAERWAIDATLRDQEHPGGWIILAKIGLLIGRPDATVRFLRRVLDRSPRHRVALDLLERVRGVPPSPPPPPGSVLVIREWRAGLWSEVDHMVNASVLAQALGRTPVALWGQDSFYAEPGVVDSWSRYFEPLSEITAESIVGPHAEVYPHRWRNARLDAPNPLRNSDLPYRITAPNLACARERVALVDMHHPLLTILHWLPEGHPWFGMTPDEVHPHAFSKVMRPHARYRARADAFFDQHLRGGPTLAVHVRGSDKVHEHASLHKDNLHYEPMVREFLAANTSGKVFLCTDTRETADRFASLFPRRVVLTEARRADGPEAVHTSGAHAGPALAEEVILDVLIASKCDRFLGMSMSSVSCAIAALLRGSGRPVTMLGPPPTPNAYVTLFQIF